MIFSILMSLSVHSHMLVYCTLIAVNARQRENSFFFGKLLFLTLTSSNSISTYAIALKFSVKQINLIRQKSVSAICKIMDINVLYRDFRIFVSASNRVFLKKTKTIKIKSKFFFFEKWRTHFCRECYDLESWHVPKFREKY